MFWRPWDTFARRYESQAGGREREREGERMALYGDALSFLLRHDAARRQVDAILRAEDPLKPYAIHIEFLALANAAPALAAAVSTSPARTLPVLHAAAVEAQETRLRCSATDDNDGLGGSVADGEVKLRVTTRVRMFRFPEHAPPIGSVRVEHIGRFVSLGEGTVVRSGQARIIESHQIYHCAECGRRVIQFADHGNGSLIDQPRECSHHNCGSTKLKRLDEDAILQDYQEISLQESLQTCDSGKTPRHIPVILTGDLAKSCTTGDEIMVSGEIIYRWRQFRPGARCDVEMVVIANHVQVFNKKGNAHQLTPSLVAQFENFWTEHESEPLHARDMIVSGMCPQLYGMYFVKLSLILMLVGGVPRESGNDNVNVNARTTNHYTDNNGMSRNRNWYGGQQYQSNEREIHCSRIRGDIHVLIVGDPGTGKSQFLKFASRVSHRSVLTSGMGTTAAGLTCTAVKDGGEWGLEAGALVLADGGLCCIDEFSAIRSSDYESIHEAMEQQTISIAKAGIVAKLNTRASVFGVMNPKGLYDTSQSVANNCSLTGPLLSRFDVILVLLDTKDPSWDAMVSSHILNGCPVNGGVENRQMSIQYENSSSYKDERDNIFLNIETMRNYISYVRDKYNPKLTESAELVLSTYWNYQRGNAERNASRTTIRMLESLIRLAQAHARLMARDQVLIVDAVYSVLIIESSMHNSSLLDANAMQSDFALDPDGDYLELEASVFKMLNLA